jgi:hypothetical protein
MLRQRDRLIDDHSVRRQCLRPGTPLTGILTRHSEDILEQPVERLDGLRAPLVDLRASKCLYKRGVPSCRQ